jgi:glutamate 5-kinase
LVRLPSPLLAFPKFGWEQKTDTVSVKGTSSIVDEKTHEPLLPILTLIVDTAVKLRKHGHRVIIVSSGAIGVGLRRMDVEKKPKHLAKLQVSPSQLQL